MCVQVFSFVGVVLIARPEFLFGRQRQDEQDGGEGLVRIVTPAQRLVAVRYVGTGAHVARITHSAMLVASLCWELWD